MHTGVSLLDFSAGSFDDIARGFSWQIPARFNMAWHVCTRHAGEHNPLALIAESASGRVQRLGFLDLELRSNQLANLLRGEGVQRGDRVAVILPQCPETALVHLATHKLGAISLPLSVLFGNDALQYRLADSAARVLVTHAARLPQIETLAPALPALDMVLCVSDTPSDPPSGRIPARHFGSAVAAEGDSFDAVATQADDPALLLYTSGTTGPPKGALIAHRALLGNLPGFEMSHNGFPVAGDRLYTPADWAWTGGLLDGLLPAWYYGVPVIAYESFKFDAEATAALMHRHRVTTAFIPPTALKMLRHREAVFRRYPPTLRSIMSAGETVGAELYHWVQRVLGVELNEMCGQTEHNYLMGNCSRLLPVKPGSMGKAYPGHRVAIMQSDGRLAACGETGEIVAWRHDPVHFLGYWQQPDATERKYTGDWFHTGDMGYQDSDGYLWFVGRADDVISSAGYRIGPGEIEDCVLKHPAVLQVAAIGVPDPQGLRGEVVKLYVVLREGIAADESLCESLRTHVRNYLAAYEYPRLIEFCESLPMTTTGKVQRAVLRQRHRDTLSTER